MRTPLFATLIVASVALGACEWRGRELLTGGDEGAAAGMPKQRARLPDAVVAPRDGTARRPESPAIDAEPDGLLGLDPPALRARLGEPAQLRREQPAQVWQYRARGCVLDLFLYPEAAGLAVVHVEARDTAARPMAGRDCLERLLHARG